VIEDLGSGELRRSIEKDLREVYRFYVDDQDRVELATIHPSKRWFHIAMWMVKNSVLHLTPGRRIMLLVAGLLFVNGIGGPGWSMVLAFLDIFVILMLELKDKLMAQDELETGRAVQAALMPRDSPRLSGWDVWLYTRSANQVGGDLVDYIQLDDDRVGVAIGDVAGKGLGAALYMARLQSTLRALAPLFESRGALGTEINGIFRRDGLADRFVSLLYLELERNTDRVAYLNAGHFPPLIVRSDRVDTAARGSAAIGIVNDPVFKDQELRLSVGDVAVLYSDGVTEARDDEGDFFGDERFLAHLRRMHNLPAETVGRRILSYVDVFVGDAPQTDDLSIIIIRRTADQPALPAPRPAD
jgi:serine phosphatase RsbU (regulator of sigma subunit)